MAEEHESLSYSEIRHRMNRHLLRQLEIPTEHSISLPVPTRRWGRPAFAFFASPAARQPGRPMRQSPPDRWWAFDARNGQLLAYALCHVVPFSETSGWTTVEIPAPADSVSAVKQLIRDIEEMSDVLTPSFFRDEAGDAATRESLVIVLRQFLPPPLIEQYRGLAVDYFSWLHM